jgi:hypothetical protein
VFRLYLAVEPESPSEDDDDGLWLVLVWEDRARVPVGIRYGDTGSLYRGARRILDRHARGLRPLKQLRGTRESHAWRKRLGRRVDLSDEARLLRSPPD